MPTQFPATALALAALALAPNVVTTPCSAANYAAEVIHYTPGTAAAPGYDQTAAILGEPSRITPGEFGGPVDPFSGPWQATQLLSVGAGGSVTVRFEAPVFDHPSHPFGLDFLVFGSSAFVITNGDFTGGGITDGSLFGNSGGITQVSVSVDGISFFRLDPARVPVIDALFPTDGSGDFTRPVPPGLGESDFAGLNLDGIRALYAGAGGGAGFDIGWAQDTTGIPVVLDRIEYVRLEVLSDRIEVDALSAIPEPGSPVLLAVGGIALFAVGHRRRGLRHERPSRPTWNPDLQIP